MTEKMIIIDSIDYILNNVIEASQCLKKEDITSLMDLILNADAIFVMGAGRSGLVAKAFAMRLMHLSRKVYVMGETITPAINEDDLLITISGSGETTNIVSSAESAVKRGAKVITLTSSPKSTLGRISDQILLIKGRTKEDHLKKDFDARQLAGEHVGLAPLGTLFEITALVFLDGLIAELMVELGLTEDDLGKKHVKDSKSLAQSKLEMNSQ